MKSAQKFAPKTVDSVQVPIGQGRNLPLVRSAYVAYSALPRIEAALSKAKSTKSSTKF